jgi:hypothetical protein
MSASLQESYLLDFTIVVTDFAIKCFLLFSEHILMDLLNSIFLAEFLMIDLTKFPLLMLVK